MGIILKVNPSEKCLKVLTNKMIKDFYKRNKKKINGISFEEFQLATKKYFEQHGRLPEKLKTINASVPCNVNALVDVGQLVELRYQCSSKSRKGNYIYKHKSSKARVLSDTKGNLYIVGSKVKGDGWIHY